MYYEYYYIFPSFEREKVLKNAPKMRNLCKKEIASNHELDESYIPIQYTCASLPWKFAYKFMAWIHEVYVYLIVPREN